MLRNELFNQLRRYDNDAVVVELNGIFVAVEDARPERECVVLVLDPDDLQDALKPSPALARQTQQGSEEPPGDGGRPGPVVRSDDNVQQGRGQY
jgi:hypothetical protein